MNKEDYLKIVKEKLKDNRSRVILLNQIEIYYNAKDNYKSSKHGYKRIRVWI